LLYALTVERKKYEDLHAVKLPEIVSPEALKNAH
jgi:hypothetical protein